MLKNLKTYLKERWDKITYRQLIIFYLILGIVLIISFTVAVLDKAWHTWKIVPIVLFSFWLVSMFLYYRFQDEIEKKKKS